MTPRAVNPWLSELPKYTLLRNDERKAKLSAAGVPIFDFGIGDPQEQTPSFIRDALIAAIPHVSQYPSSQGTLDFRKACAQWLSRRFNVTVNPATQIISSNGSKEAIFHIPHVLVNATSQRRIVVFPDPGFPVYKGSCLLAGAVGYQVTLRPENNYVFEPESIPLDLLPQIAAVWVSYPHNPTGAQIARPQMEKIYAWALAHNIILLSDECYADMFFPGSPAPDSFLSVAAQQNFKNVLAFFSLSKRSGMTGYRSGFVAGDPELVGLFAKYRPHAGLGTPEFVQKAAIAAWNDDAHAIERNAIFAQKRATVDAFLDKHKFEYLKSTATFYVWVRVPPSFSSGEEYAAKLADATGIVVTPGDALGDSCNLYFRLALVPTVEKIKECLALWDSAVAKGLHS